MKSFTSKPYSVTTLSQIADKSVAALVLQSNKVLRSVDDVAQFEQLQKLVADDNQLASIHIPSHAKLTYLSASLNRIASVALPPQMSVLILGQNRIYSLEFCRGLAHLRHLDVSSNPVSVLCPLLGLRLQYLNIRGTDVTNARQLRFVTAKKVDTDFGVSN